MAEIDHLVIGARTLEDGAAFVRARFGVEPLPGGRHEGAGTHNLLLGLGPDRYLEILAIDPTQAEPAEPRPFGLDDLALRTALDAEPRLIAWVARSLTLAATVERLGPRRTDAIRALRRGDLHWTMAFPPTGQAMGGLVPALIEWPDGSVAGRLADSGCRLRVLEGEHPNAEAAMTALAERGLTEALNVRLSPHARLVARFVRPDGREFTLATG